MLPDHEPGVHFSKVIDKLRIEKVQFHLEFEEVRLCGHLGLLGYGAVVRRAVATGITQAQTRVAP